MDKIESVLELNLHDYPGIESYIFQNDFIEGRNKINP